MTTQLYSNITTEEYRNSQNEIVAYRLIPDEGYVIHINSRDEILIDEETGLETGEKKLGYTRTFVQVCAEYDFEANPLGIYAIREEDACEKSD